MMRRRDDVITVCSGNVTGSVTDSEEVATRLIDGQEDPLSQHALSELEGSDRDCDLLLQSQGSVPSTSKCCFSFKRHPVVKFLRSWWRSLVVILPPLLLLPLPILWRTNASRTLYVILIIGMYWVTEVIPIAATALLPLVLFPALGILSSDTTARNYLKDTNMLFVGGLMMAVAVEKWEVHKRIALLILMLVGSRPKWLLLGFMAATGFLSMWISNTATAAMMLPIAQAVLLEIKQKTQPVPSSTVTEENSGRKLGGDVETSVRFTKRSHASLGTGGDGNHGLPGNADESRVVFEEQTTGVDAVIFRSGDPPGPDAANSTARDKSFHRLAKSLMLGIAYAANIGGTGTLIGTGPNIILAGLASDLGVNFALWFVFAIPPMLLALVLSWVYLSVLYCDDSFSFVKMKFFKRQACPINTLATQAAIKNQYKKLGRFRYAEGLVLAMFGLLVLLWLFREPHFISGWGVLFRAENGTSYVSDATAAIAVVFLLFLIPSEPCCCTWTNILKAGSSPRLLDWESIQSKLPWNVIILLGSGFAIAEAASESGLSDWAGSKLTIFEAFPAPVVALFVSVIVASFTEFISNVATTTLFLPILRTLAITLCIHPLYLMIPAAVSASYAFMVPVATPPNAIAFSYGYIKVYNMVFTGIFMNVLCVAIVSLALNVAAVPLFGLHDFPVNILNGTTCNTNGTAS